MEMNLDILKTLSELPGVPGWEDPVREFVQAQLESLGLSYRGDAMGNVLVHLRGSGPKLLIDAHMDEIGFYVRYIDDKGFLRLQPAGGFDPKNLLARQVVVHSRSGDLAGILNPGGRPVHIASPEERAKVPELKTFFVDLVQDPAWVKERVRVGDPVTLLQEAGPIGNGFMGKAMDDRASVFLLLELLKSLTGRNLKYDLYVAFTVQEEVGLRGAMTAAFGVDPEIAIALDTTLAVDLPGIPEDEGVLNFGGGVGIKVMDSSAISDRGLLLSLVDLAEQKQIPYQMEILPQGGTDAGAMQRVRAGVKAITLSIPTRYIHTVTETVHIADLQAELDLLLAYLLLD